MSIEVLVKVGDNGEELHIDGHQLITKEVIKNSDIVEWMEAMGYIIIKVEE